MGGGADLASERSIEPVSGGGMGGVFVCLGRGGECGEEKCGLDAFCLPTITDLQSGCVGTVCRGNGWVSMHDDRSQELRESGPHDAV